MRTWAPEGTVCQAGSGAVGDRLPSNGDSLALEIENLQPGPGRMLGGRQILSVTS